jgi:hypothetical protein
MQTALLSGNELEMPLMTPANDFFVDGPWYFLAAYAKPAAALLVLRQALSPEVFDRALREYAARWTNKHPTPWDFFNTMENVSGQDLDWFWRGWFFDRGVLDQGIVGVETGAGTVLVTVESKGELQAPATVEVENDAGEKASATLQGGAWACGARQVVEVAIGGRPKIVSLNADEPFPDSDPTDNHWTAPAPGD